MIKEIFPLTPRLQNRLPQTFCVRSTNLTTITSLISTSTYAYKFNMNYLIFYICSTFKVAIILFIPPHSVSQFNRRNSSSSNKKRSLSINVDIRRLRLLLGSYWWLDLNLAKTLSALITMVYVDPHSTFLYSLYQLEADKYRI